MKTFSSIAVGFFLILASLTMVSGALIMATAEGDLQFTPTFPPTETMGLPTPGQDTPTPRPTYTPPPPTACPPPPGWEAFVIQNGDTLDALAQVHLVSVELITQANCLLSTTLLPGSLIYLPPLPTPTATATLEPSKVEPSETPSPTNTARPTTRPCGPPAGWIQYRVRQGDTLFGLSLAFRTTVQALQTANCLESADYIQAGALLWVPNVATRTVPVTPTATDKPPATPKPTTAVPPTPVPTTAVPPTDIPPTDVPPTDIPPTTEPTAYPAPGG
ncbi:MAG: LysM peptidoglycan-binding domain-containing protein [Anaerolineae bacterium]|nr:LysM peptidoglycan-binding domain-containing protein [Anaerolineae bacterium]